MWLPVIEHGASMTSKSQLLMGFSFLQSGKRTSYHKDDITFLASAIPINLYLPRLHPGRGPHTTYNWVVVSNGFGRGSNLSFSSGLKLYTN